MWAKSPLPPHKSHILILLSLSKSCFWSVSILYADSHSHLKKTMSSWQTSTLSYQYQVRWREWGFFFNIGKDNLLSNTAHAQNVLKYECICLCIWMLKDSRVQKAKACSTSFFPHKAIAPQFRPPATHGQRSWLFTLTSHPHCTLWSDCCWDAHNALPTSHHIWPSQ